MNDGSHGRNECNARLLLHVASLVELHFDLIQISGSTLGALWQVCPWSDAHVTVRTTCPVSYIIAYLSDKPGVSRSTP